MRTKKRPYGPDNNTLSPARSFWCTQVVALPPGTCRTLSSIVPPACGALAIENARGALSPGMRRLMYWPAWKAIGLSSAIHTPLMVGVRPLHARHRAGVIEHRQVLRIGLLVDLGLDRHVRLEGGAAGQALPLVALVVHQREVADVAVLDLAVGHVDLAGRAQAVAAGVRQVDAGAQRSVEDGLTLLDLQHLAERLDGE